VSIILSLGKSFANQAMRRTRHARLKSIHPLLQNWEEMEMALSPEELQQKAKFFRNIFLSVMGVFVFSSFVPYLQKFDAEFWPIPSTVGVFSENFSLAEDGYISKPNIPTENIAINRKNISETITYTVQNGDTLSGIADRFQITVQTLLENNTIQNRNVLKTGQQLVILPVDGLLIEVQKGDSVNRLADQYKIQKQDILTQNQFSEGIVLAVGQKLILPGARKPEPIIIPAEVAVVQTNKNTPSKTVQKTSSGAQIKNVKEPVAIEKWSGGKLLFPTTTRNITQGYHHGHYAIDIADRSKPDILAAADGVIIKAESSGWNSGYGNVIIIDHGNGMQTLYGHNSLVYVKEGQKVGRGQSIAKMGNTGRVYGATGIHVHFEVRLNGDKKNPMSYF
jgi:murein DD-endopeptidase MepM/ murein hydrolase activator NlpD